LELDKKDILDLEIETSTICQAQCPLCFRNYKVFNAVYPNTIQRDLDELIRQLESYSNLEYIRLVGSISEPTLYKNFFDLVKYIKKRDISIEICTNGDTHNTTWWKKLGSLLNNKDKVYFSICGSTQELHEKYRKNTNLANILKNAKALRSIIKIDYAQCIRFDYNSEDFDNNLEDFLKDFSNIYWTETFLKKDKDNYKDTNNLDFLKPNPKKIKSYYTIEQMANKRFKDGSHKTHCKSFNDKSQIMDIRGNIYPCYLFMEAAKGVPWDGDYNKIRNLEYEVCKFCEEGLVKIIQGSDLTYII